MIDYELSDGGKKESGIKGIRNDCAVRAISIIMKKNSQKMGCVYIEVFNKLTQKKFEKYGDLYRTMKIKRNSILKIGFSKDVYESYLEDENFKKIELERYITWTCAYEKYGNCLVLSKRKCHIAAIREKKVMDDHDSRKYRTLEKVKSFKDFFDRKRFYAEEETNVVYIRKQDPPLSEENSNKPKEPTR